ncbi:hypothetical protein P0Y35_11705 [Kiritimatiellaeota bacterium B1221]|nr:hypothetical protein [Kiritimatiellaeota bacterium B1221]
MYQELIDITKLLKDLGVVNMSMIRVQDLKDELENITHKQSVFKNYDYFVNVSFDKGKIYLWRKRDFVKWWDNLNPFETLYKIVYDSPDGGFSKAILLPTNQLNFPHKEIEIPEAICKKYFEVIEQKRKQKVSIRDLCLWKERQAISAVKVYVLPLMTKKKRVELVTTFAEQVIRGDIRVTNYEDEEFYLEVKNDSPESKTNNLFLEYDSFNRQCIY